MAEYSAFTTPGSAGISGVDAASPVTVIEASRGWVPLRLAELWEYREVLYFLVWRDLKARYRQTLLGVAWAIIQPLFTMVLFTVIFGKLAKIPSDGLPYAVFSLAALVPWNFFSTALTQSSNSLVHNSHILRKVYFPRLFLPLGRVLGCVPDLALAFALLLIIAWRYGLHPSLGSLCWVPLFVLLAFVTALAAGLWLSALNVRFRDIQHLIPFLTQFWLFATPIVYPSSLLPARWRPLYALNPMVGVVDGFRWALLGTGDPPGTLAAASALGALVVLTAGALFFRRVEKTFADVV
jgi:lipopolysaccharide transport system permease protein